MCRSYYAWCIGLCRGGQNRTFTLISFAGGFQLGYWPDLDSMELRDALRIAGVAQLEMVDLNSADVAEHFQQRSCPVRRPNETFRAWEARALALQKKQAA